MAAGRKRKPTKLKQLQGTIEKSRLIDNEMSVSACKEIPIAPKWFSEIAKTEWNKVVLELYNKQMLFKVDLSLIAAYCNKMALHIEMEIMLREKGRVQIFRNEDGSVKYVQQVAYQSIGDKALEQALKIATQFGLTPSSRSGISQPQMVTNTQYNFFE